MPAPVIVNVPPEAFVSSMLPELSLFAVNVPTAFVWFSVAPPLESVSSAAAVIVPALCVMLPPAFRSTVPAPALITPLIAIASFSLITRLPPPVLTACRLSVPPAVLLVS